MKKASAAAKTPDQAKAEPTLAERVESLKQLERDIDALPIISRLNAARAVARGTLDILGEIAGKLDGGRE
jgi:hypothetical protein